MYTYLPGYSPLCCDRKNEVTADMICSKLPEVLQKYAFLCERQKTLTTPRKRLIRLSQPVCFHTKFQEACPCRDGQTRKVEIRRLEEHVSTRIEQLAYPQVSKLLMLKRRESFNNFEPDRKQKVNSMIWKSLHSLYSHLSNTQPPKPKKKPTPRTKQEWLIHKTYTALLSKPKKEPVPPKVKETKKTLKSLKRTHRLAKPKEWPEIEQPEWHLTDKQKKYVPSQRILKLSKHKDYHEDDYNPYQVKPEALQYKASKRIKELAVAALHISKKDDRDTNVFQTSPKAIKYKVTPRTLKLSKPRSYIDLDVGDPYEVKRSALRYKITKRLRELSKPRVYPK